MIEMIGSSFQSMGVACSVDKFVFERQCRSETVVVQVYFLDVCVLSCGSPTFRGCIFGVNIFVLRQQLGNHQFVGKGVLMDGFWLSLEVLKQHVFYMLLCVSFNDHATGSGTAAAVLTCG